MKGINNSNVVLRPTGLNKNDAKLLKTIFSGAVSSGDKTKAGDGYMGLALDVWNNGKPVENAALHSVKFMTHWYERGTKTDSQIMQSVKSNRIAGEAAFIASEQLEHSLRTMAEKVGVDKTVDALLTDYKQKSSYESRTLLSRKIVFQVATIINNESARLKGKSVKVANVATKSSFFVNTRVTALNVDGDTVYNDEYENILRGFKPGKKFLARVAAALDTKAYGVTADAIRSCVKDLKNNFSGLTDRTLTTEKLKALLVESIEEYCRLKGKSYRETSPEYILYEKVRGLVRKVRKQPEFLPPAGLSQKVGSLLNNLKPVIVSAAIAQRAEPGENRWKTVAQLERFWPAEGSPFAAAGLSGLTDKKMIQALADLKMRKGKRPVNAKDVLGSVKGMCPRLSHRISDIARSRKADLFVQKMCRLLNMPSFNATLVDLEEPENGGNAEPTLLSKNKKTVLAEPELTYFEDELLQQPKYRELFNLPAQVGGKDTSYEDVLKKFGEVLGTETANALGRMTKKLKSKPAVLMEALKVIFAETAKEIQKSKKANGYRRGGDPFMLDNWICQTIEDRKIKLERVTDLVTLKKELANYRKTVR